MLAASVSTLFAGAFSPDIYPETSPLATGKWVKVAVPKSGLYRLDAASLRAMGFSDASRVRVYGNGGGRISDILTSANVLSTMARNRCLIHI